MSTDTIYWSEGDLSFYNTQRKRSNTQRVQIHIWIQVECNSEGEETDFHKPTTQTLFLMSFMSPCCRLSSSSGRQRSLFDLVKVKQVSCHWFPSFRLSGVFSSERMAAVFSYESSEVDWCEDNYKHSEHVVEYFNTVRFTRPFHPKFIQTSLTIIGMVCSIRQLISRCLALCRWAALFSSS